MFTGIIKSIGEINKINEKEQGIELVIAFDVNQSISIGSSVCICGVCLTVTDLKDNLFSFDVMPETIRKTTLNFKQIGSKVNIEMVLRVGDELGGHFVYGHIDGIGKVVSIKNEGDNKLVEFEVDNDIMKYIVPQGSVAVDGVSLTVARLGSNTFTVSLIPFTLENTTLGELRVGEKVNIESDMLAKFANKS
ncbi:MAG: riboflavin synthase subunit alpha [Candidatus Magasanikbacteria bacterium RIFCSPHIGHO2_01_FULL_33_34]|uniref:Riboflavin synthase n=1 Tax=Candidatus Magasanikbacteria bacterium RIFCSPHIGHO2_01_FULL_33_34 TaxID=1798671 RepID=A0A1F6LL09_9BACT|nr:MAG: riboflavin synthase subunit alpha [Candidatus Magasanikbacteria bacterium RIFCSPHIGHO2_01_FULL_33_34]OGH65796.1 MAG: riboflavin synthase subunit alpha [Candidatus Magasanikbacteria bacterium RIFCSPHIGHO2_02_FULL_33_17]OGH75161.1 MAG: riboflavin synthase subunit alpha [Candidatus Magasanikbacteria bacterium RIFCSPLOWO2_01_FULL_33_34]OGH81550.1 MAG: riboflavin synthase subunit alpha [Candidatus Magasanikbacteria bacterium RIFCSPLOWO2_12_FULL_34_7]